MARYEVQHSYRSNDYGPFEKGTQIELDPAEAEWINKDSPGTLVEVDPEEQAKAKRERRQAEVAKRAEAKKKADDG
ncbi:MAG TPA: hypothetical protein VFR23_13840 [Jiangellaceae bacterium]|nr:hypothetical protein [Jiangellaceae bacterium]